MFVGDGQADVARAGEEIVINGNTIPVGDKMNGNIIFENDPSTADKDEYIKIKWEINKTDSTLAGLNKDGFYATSVAFFVKSGISSDFTYSGSGLGLKGVYEPHKEQARHSYTYRAYAIFTKQTGHNLGSYAKPLTDNDGTIDYFWKPEPQIMGDGIFMRPIVATAPDRGLIKDGDKYIFNLYFSIMYLGSLVPHTDGKVRHEIKHTYLYNPATDSGSVGDESANEGVFFDIDNIDTGLANTYNSPSSRSLGLPKVGLAPGNYYYRAIVTHCDFGEGQYYGPKIAGNSIIANDLPNCTNFQSKTSPVRTLNVSDEGVATDNGIVDYYDTEPDPNYGRDNIDGKTGETKNTCSDLLQNTGWWQKFTNQKEMICAMVEGLVNGAGAFFHQGTKFAIRGMESSNPDPAGSVAININDYLDRADGLKTAWKYTLGIVNFILLLILIVIGFGTIFHIQIDTYHIKAAIVPIIIGVVLANFSFLICRFFLDLSNVMTVTFVNSATDNGSFSKMGDELAKLIIPGAESFANDSNTNVDPFAANSTAMAFLKIFFMVSVFVAPIMLVVGALMFLILAGIPGAIMWVLGVLFYARTILLFILIVLSPIAFFCVWWPPLQGFFKKWWNQFIQWTFLVPVSFFFFWAAIQINEFTKQGNNEPALWKYILGLLIIFLAASVPFKMGGAVGAVISGYAKKFGTGALGVAKSSAWNTTNRQMEKNVGHSFRSVGGAWKDYWTKKDQYSMANSRSAEKIESVMGTRVNPFKMRQGLWQGVKTGVVFNPKKGWHSWKGIGQAGTSTARERRVATMVRGGDGMMPTEEKMAELIRNGTEEQITQSAFGYLQGGGSLKELNKMGLEGALKNKMNGEDFNSAMNIYRKTTRNIHDIDSGNDEEDRRIVSNLINARGGPRQLLSNDVENNEAFIDEGQVGKIIKALEEVTNASGIAGVDGAELTALKAVATKQIAYYKRTNKDPGERSLKSSVIGDRRVSQFLQGKGDELASAIAGGLTNGQQIMLGQINSNNAGIVQDNAVSSGHEIMAQMEKLADTNGFNANGALAQAGAGIKQAREIRERSVAPLDPATARPTPVDEVIDYKGALGRKFDVELDQHLANMFNFNTNLGDTITSIDTSITGAGRDDKIGKLTASVAEVINKYKTGAHISIPTKFGLDPDVEKKLISEISQHLADPGMGIATLDSDWLQSYLKSSGYRGSTDRIVKVADKLSAEIDKQQKAIQYAETGIVELKKLSSTVPPS